MVMKENIKTTKVSHGSLLMMDYQFVGQTPIKGDKAELYMSPMFEPKTINSECYFIHFIENEYRWYRNSVEWFPIECIEDLMAIHRVFTKQPLIKK
jgi:hypothetical protein